MEGGSKGCKGSEQVRRKGFASISWLPINMKYQSESRAVWSFGARRMFIYKVGLNVFIVGVEQFLSQHFFI